MASRKRSEPTQHETYPGPGPGRVDRGTSGIHPVEQMVDAAIERIARERGVSRDMTPHALDATPRAHPDTTPQHAIVPRTATHALARPVDIKRPGRLRWRGQDVSPEFREYAERVARGEDLPPFEGRILAEPSSKFPWEPEVMRKKSRRAVRLQVLLWSSAAVVAGLLTWSVAIELSTPPSQTFNVAPTPSTAVLSNRSVAPETSSDTRASKPERALGEERPATEKAPPPPVPVEPAQLSPPVRSPASAPALAPPPRPAPVAQPAPAPIYARQAPVDTPPAEAGRSVPVDIAAPGALREALGALLSARAGDATGPAEGAPATSAGSAPAQPSPAASSGAPAAAAAGKEPSGEASTKGSLLVEKPSF